LPGCGVAPRETVRAVDGVFACLPRRRPGDPAERQAMMAKNNQDSKAELGRNERLIWASFPPVLKDAWPLMSQENKDQVISFWNSLSQEDKDKVSTAFSEVVKISTEHSANKFVSWSQEIYEIIKDPKKRDNWDSFARKLQEGFGKDPKREEESLSKLKELYDQFDSDESREYVWDFVACKLQELSGIIGDPKKREEGIYEMRNSLHLPKIIPGKGRPEKFQWLFEYWVRHYLLKVKRWFEKEENVNNILKSNYFQKRYDTTDSERMCLFQYVIQSRGCLNDILREIDDLEKLPGYDPKKRNVHVLNMIKVGHAMLKIGTKYKDNIVYVLELMRCVEFANDRIEDLYPSDDHREPRPPGIQYLRDCCFQAERVIASLAVKASISVCGDDYGNDLTIDNGKIAIGGVPAKMGPKDQMIFNKLWGKKGEAVSCKDLDDQYIDSTTRGIDTAIDRIAAWIKLANLHLDIKPDKITIPGCRSLKAYKMIDNP
jgi:hypothetical protein